MAITVNPLPTLSSSGWVTGIAHMADRLLAYYFVNRYSQSQIYYGQVVSLPYVIQQYTQDPAGLCTAIQQSVLNYLLSYFDTANVDVTWAPTVADAGIINISLSGNVTLNTKQYDIGFLIGTSNGAISSITNLLIQ